MNNITLLIHYYRDSPERERNLIAVCKWLQSIGIEVSVWSEDKGNSSRFTWDYAWYCGNLRDDDLIHRTRALNLLAEEAKTEYLGIWDTDVVLHKSQILQSMHLLETGQADCVYPYSGEFRNYFPDRSRLFCETLSIDDLIYTSDYRVRRNRNMVGGALLIRRDKYLEIGGENERFISYGPEDKERFHRIKSLLTYARVPGPLLHLDHPRLENTSTTHKYFDSNVAECEKVCAMGPDELRAYIKTWEWVK